MTLRAKPPTGGFYKKGVLRNFTKFKRDPDMFTCEFCEISWNTFLQNTFGPLLLDINGPENLESQFHTLGT